MTAQTTDGSAYFMYHSIGQYPGKARAIADAMAEFAESWGAPDLGQWGYALGKRAEFIAHWQRLINAPDGSVTTSENVTAAFYALLGALPDEVLKGREVLVAGDCFPSMHFLLTGLAERYGFTLKTVPLRQGAHWVEDEDVLSAWGPEVGLALLTWVSSTSSHRIDLDAMVAHGRRKGSVIGIDITQAAGLLPFDVMAPAVDFTVSTSLKWMCGTPGAGILHVAPDLIARSEPEFRGWFSQPNPFSWDLDQFAFAPDIRRFDNGTPSVMSALASLPAMEWHATQDHAALLAHNRRLTARIIDAAPDLGLTLATPQDEAARGGSIMLRLPDTRPAGETVSILAEKGIQIDNRSQTIRLSPGVMTTDDGVTRVLEALAAA